MPTVYITAPPESAGDLARTLVEEELAACVNRVPCHSVYRWDGTVHEEEETILLAKTTDGSYEGMKERVVELHPHDVPCIERFDEADVLPAYAEWVESVTGGE